MGRSIEQIEKEIEERLGFVPPFFAPARRSPMVLENLWYQTRTAYLDNPLPALFKEKLAALLARYCAVPYCLMCHSASLRPLGMKAADVLSLLAKPATGFDELRDDNANLTRLVLGEEEWPAPESDLEQRLLSCSVGLFLGQDAERCQSYLREVLGEARYDLLILYIAYNRTALTWAEAHPELAHDADLRVREHLGPLLEDEPALGVFFQNYRARVTDQEDRRSQWLSLQHQTLLRQERELRESAEQVHRELRTTASWLNATLSSIGDAVIAVSGGDHPTIVFMNAIAEELTGWRLEEARGQPVLEVFNIINSKTRQPAFNPVARVIAEGRAVGLANHTALIGRDGREHIIEDSAAPIVGDDGVVNGVVLVFRDATLKHSLEERSALLTSVIESSNDFIGIAGADGKAFYVNPAGRALLGIDSIESVTQTVILDYFAEQDRARVSSEVMPQLLETGSWDGRVLFQNFATGERIPVSWNVFVISDPETRGIAAIACVSRDLRDRELRDRAIAEAQRAREDDRSKLEAMFTISPIGLALVRGSDLVFEKTNVTFEQLVSAREYIGRPWRDVYSELSDSPLIEIMGSVLESGQAFVAKDERLLVHYDGKLQDRYYDFTYNQVQDSRGAAYGILIQCTEVTDRVQTRLRMEENERLLAEARDESERANRAKSTFLANMSHEIRTPLGAIMGFAELMTQPTMPLPEIQRCIAIISRNSSQLLRIIDDILDLSKVEAGRMDIEAIRFSLTETLSDIASLLSLRARENSIHFELHAATPLPEHVIADPTRLRQILFNVVGNAIKFTDHGSVALTVSFLDSELQFKVTDTGKGISPEQASRLFTAFSQADAATNRQYGGTGLGLVLTRSLCRAMGGDFYLLESEPGRGSTFIAKVRVEVAVDSRLVTEIDLAFANASLPLEDDVRLLAGMKLLLVEDSPDNRELLVFILAKAGARIDVAFDGSEGVAKALAGDYDAVLMDVQMPGMDGLEAVSSLRAHGFDAPIIALTAHAMKEQRETSLRMGFTHFLAKPVQRVRLLRLLEAIRGQKHAESPGADATVSTRVLVVDDDDDTRELIQTYLDSQGFETSGVATGRQALEALDGELPPHCVILDMTLPDMTGEDVLRAVNQRADRRALQVVLASGWDLTGRLPVLGADAYLQKPISLTALGATMLRTRAASE